MFWRGSKGEYGGIVNISEIGMGCRNSSGAPILSRRRLFFGLLITGLPGQLAFPGAEPPVVPSLPVLPRLSSGPCRHGRRLCIRRRRHLNRRDSRRHRRHGAYLRGGALR